MDDLTFKAAEMVMGWPSQPVGICECVTNISKLLCIQIMKELGHDFVEDPIDPDSSSMISGANSSVSAF